MPANTETPPRPRKARRLLQRLAASAIAVFATLLAVEVLLRAVGISHPLPYSPDEYCATRLAAGFRGYWSKEGGARIQVNEAGFRDNEHAKAKPPRTIRIAVLGDSYIEAFQVSIDHMFGSVLERELNRLPMEPGQTVEVLSFGVAGWGTASELMALRHHVWQYDPDVILLAFFPGNDVRNNSRELEPMDCRPFFVLEDGELVPDLAFRQDPRYVYANQPSSEWKRRIINASRLLQVVQAARNAIAERAETAAQRRNETQEGTPATAEIGLDDGCFLPPENPAWQAAWELTDRLIEQCHLETASHDKLFAVMPVTVGVQVHPDPTYRQAYAQRIGTENLLYPNRRLRALGADLGFAVIPIVEEMADYAERRDVFLHGFPNTELGQGHWNEEGHRLAAEICARKLTRIWRGEATRHDDALGSEMTK